MVRAFGGSRGRRERGMEGHVWHELCKQLLKYACLLMCACVCTKGSRRLVNGTNGHGGPRKKEQACCYRGRMASPGRGLLHLGSHTPPPHPPTQNTHAHSAPDSKHTPHCRAPKGRSSQNFSFANEVGRGLHLSVHISRFMWQTALWKTGIRKRGDVEVKTKEGASYLRSSHCCFQLQPPCFSINV